MRDDVNLDACLSFLLGFWPFLTEVVRGLS